MKRSTKNNIRFFNRFREIFKYRQLIRSTLYEEYNHLIYAETPNLYKEINLGYKDISYKDRIQTVKLKKIINTDKSSFISVSNDFTF